MHAVPVQPSPWVKRFVSLIRPGGRVLDLACGSGRHVRYLASLGHALLGIDRDAAALTSLRDIAETLCADLEGGPWPLPEDCHFDGIVVTNYLHRPLLPCLSDALAPGGVLIYETFAVGNETIGKPSNPSFLLETGELLRVFGGILRVVAFEDGFIAQPKSAYVQRLCAVRADDDGGGVPSYRLDAGPT